MIDRWFGIGLNGLIFLCLTLAKAPQARPSLYMVLDRSNSDGLWGEKRVWTLMILISTSLYKSAMVEREHQISSTIHCAIFNFMNFIFRFLLLQHFDISFVNSCLLLFFLFNFLICMRQLHFCFLLLLHDYVRWSFKIIPSKTGTLMSLNLRLFIFRVNLNCIEINGMYS